MLAADGSRSRKPKEVLEAISEKSSSRPDDVYIVTGTNRLLKYDKNI